MLVKDSILENLEQLPIALQEEVLHYSEYLVSRYAKEKQPTEPKKREGWGLIKGKMWMSDDFDEPLEDMKDYMI